MDCFEEVESYGLGETLECLRTTITTEILIIWEKGSVTGGWKQTQHGFTDAVGVGGRRDWRRTTALDPE